MKKRGGRTGCCCCCCRCSPAFIPIRPPSFVFACSHLPPPVPPPHSPTLIHPLPFARSSSPAPVRPLPFAHSRAPALVHIHLPSLLCMPTLVRIRPFAFMFARSCLCLPVRVHVCPLLFAIAAVPAAAVCCWHSFALPQCLLSAYIHS